MITRAQLAEMQASRPKYNTVVEYNIDGPVHTQVVSSLNAQREHNILLAERAFRDAQRHMRHDHAMSRQRGQPSAHFNNPKPRMKL